MEECNISSAVEALEDAGYEVGIVKRLPDALERLKQTQPALVIVCGRQATETCLALRTETGAPILALLTLAAETDLLAALDAGADDCQPASISNREILMRTRSLLRRGDLRSRQIHQMPGT
jgi:DNA-binding response OmpR family regulator